MRSATLYVALPPRGGVLTVGTQSASTPPVALVESVRLSTMSWESDPNFASTAAAPAPSAAVAASFLVSTLPVPDAALVALWQMVAAKTSWNTLIASGAFASIGEPCLRASTARIATPAWALLSEIGGAAVYGDGGNVGGVCTGALASVKLLMNRYVAASPAVLTFSPLLYSFRNDPSGEAFAWPDAAREPSGAAAAQSVARLGGSWVGTPLDVLSTEATLSAAFLDEPKSPVVGGCGNETIVVYACDDRGAVGVASATVCVTLLQQSVGDAASQLSALLTPAVIAAAPYAAAARLAAASAAVASSSRGSSGDSSASAASAIVSDLISATSSVVGVLALPSPPVLTSSVRDGVTVASPVDYASAARLIVSRAVNSSKIVSPLPVEISCTLQCALAADATIVLDDGLAASIVSSLLALVGNASQLSASSARSALSTLVTAVSLSLPISLLSPTPPPSCGCYAPQLAVAPYPQNMCESALLTLVSLLNGTDFSPRAQSADAASAHVVETALSLLSSALLRNGGGVGGRECAATLGSRPCSPALSVYAALLPTARAAAADTAAAVGDAGGSANFSAMSLVAPTCFTTASSSRTPPLPSVALSSTALAAAASSDQRVVFSVVQMSRSFYPARLGFDNFRFPVTSAAGAAARELLEPERASVLPWLSRLLRSGANATTIAPTPVGYFSLVLAAAAAGVSRSLTTESNDALPSRTVDSHVVRVTSQFLNGADFAYPPTAASNIVFNVTVPVASADPPAALAAAAAAAPVSIEFKCPDMTRILQTGGGSTVQPLTATQLPSGKVLSLPAIATTMLPYSQVMVSADAEPTGPFTGVPPFATEGPGQGALAPATGTRRDYSSTVHAYVFAGLPDDTQLALKTDGVAVTFRVDCGEASGFRNVTCGPGAAGVVFSFTCPVVALVPTCVWWDAGAGSWQKDGCAVSFARGAAQCSCVRLGSVALRWSLVPTEGIDVFAVIPVGRLSAEFVYSSIAWGFALGFFFLWGAFAYPLTQLDEDERARFYATLARDDEMLSLATFTEAGGRDFVIDARFDADRPRGWLTAVNAGTHALVPPRAQRLHAFLVRAGVLGDVVFDSGAAFREQAAQQHARRAREKLTALHVSLRESATTRPGGETEIKSSLDTPAAAQARSVVFGRGRRLRADLQASSAAMAASGTDFAAREIHIDDVIGGRRAGAAAPHAVFVTRNPIFAGGGGGGGGGSLSVRTLSQGGGGAAAEAGAGSSPDGKKTEHVRRRAALQAALLADDGGTAAGDVVTAAALLIAFSLQKCRVVIDSVGDPATATDILKTLAPTVCGVIGGAVFDARAIQTVRRVRLPSSVAHQDDAAAAVQRPAADAFSFAAFLPRRREADDDATREVSTVEQLEILSSRVRSVIVRRFDTTVTRAWRLRALIWRALLLRARAEHPALSVLVRFDPGTPRAFRFALFTASVLFSLCAIVFCYIYVASAKGATLPLSQRLRFLSRVELAVIGAASLPISVALTAALAHVARAVAGHAFFAERYPLLRAELLRRRSAAAHFSAMSTSELKRDKALVLSDVPQVESSAGGGAMRTHIANVRHAAFLSAAATHGLVLPSRERGLFDADSAYGEAPLEGMTAESVGWVDPPRICSRACWAFTVCLLREPALSKEAFLIAAKTRERIALMRERDVLDAGRACVTRGDRSTAYPWLSSGERAVLFGSEVRGVKFKKPIEATLLESHRAARYGAALCARCRCPARCAPSVAALCSPKHFAVLLLVAAHVGALAFLVTFASSQQTDVGVRVVVLCVAVQAARLLVLAPLLSLARILFELVVVPAWEPYVAWIPVLGPACTRAPAEGVRSAHADARALTARLEEFSFIRAAGVASGIAPNAALVALGSLRRLSVALDAAERALALHTRTLRISSMAADPLESTAVRTQLVVQRYIIALMRVAERESRERTHARR